MRVLVDTSVWSRALRPSGSTEDPKVKMLGQLAWRGELLFITGLILQEILQAFREDRTFKKVEAHLQPFPLLELERSDYVESARLYRRCASAGLSVSTTDCQIACAAIRFDCKLLTADADFERIAEVSPLELI